MGTTLREMKTEYEEYLNTLGIATLRSLGRELGVSKPTKEKSKSELIRLIIAILTGELEPIKISNRGAPVKAEAVSPSILLKLKEIGGGGVKSGEGNSLDWDIDLDEALRRLKGEDRNALFVNASKRTPEAAGKFCVGQIVKKGNSTDVYFLNGYQGDSIVSIADETMEAYSLKGGDVISYTMKKKGGAFEVSQIVRINGIESKDFKRIDFDASPICPIGTVLPIKNNKFVDWFFPISKGSRVLIYGAPKSGKTRFLKGICEETSKNREIKTFALLIEQPYETIFQFRSVMPERDLVFTSFEQDADEHLFAAQFILERAKAYAETGKGVVLVIDGLTALAKAYDEYVAPEGKPLAYGITTKPLRFLKKYLATARTLIEGGSLTIICTCAAQTGNSDDDLFVAEIAPVFETAIHLNGELAAAGVFPAVDFEDSRSYLPSENNVELKKSCNASCGRERIIELINESETCAEFFQKIEK